jgi:hypothetical protein
MGRSFFKSNLPDSKRPNPLEAFVFDGGQGPVTLISSIKDRAFIEKVGTQAAADFEMYALNLLRFYFSHFVRRDWINYFFAFMAGAAHYGLPVGRRFHKQPGLPDGVSEIVTQRSTSSWIQYPLPPPCDRKIPADATSVREHNASQEHEVCLYIYIYICIYVYIYTRQ